jgi:hypothetical protein
VQWGKAVLLEKTLKGIRRLRPAKPRYGEFWDVAVLVDHLEKLGESGELSLQDLRARTLCLWKLAAILRSSDLERISRQSLRQDDTGLLFRVNWPKEQKEPGLAAERRLETLHDHPRICPVSNWLELERRYSELGAGETDSLWRALKKPYQPLGRERISKVVLGEMARAGIDTAVFKAHSTRGAASSAALDEGASEELVMRAAHWSSRSVFERFYARRRIVASVSRNVLLPCK